MCKSFGLIKGQPYRVGSILLECCDDVGKMRLLFFYVGFVDWHDSYLVVSSTVTRAWDTKTLFGSCSRWDFILILELVITYSKTQ